jgi:hypothetical protein
LVLILLIFATPPHAVAEQHALLIGIGAYSVQPLEGPPNDAMSMQDVLTSRYGFKQENVVTLLEKDATTVRILGELERLVGIRVEEAQRASVRTDAAQCTLQVTSYGAKDFR